MRVCVCKETNSRQIKREKEKGNEENESSAPIGKNVIEN